MEISALENAIQETIAQVGKGDVVASYSESTSVDFEMDNLKSVNDNNRFSIGMRLFENGRVGNSFINSLEDTKSLVDNARQSAELGDELDIDLPPMSDYPEMNFKYQDVLDYTKEEAIEVGRKAVKRMKEIDSRVKVDAGMSKSYHRSFLSNTSGFRGSIEETALAFYVYLVLVEDNGGLLHVGDSDFAYNTALEWDRVFENVEWRYKNALKKASVNSGYMPVILAPDAIDLIIDTLAIAANGKSLYKGISTLDGKLNEKIADERFSMIDDPYYPMGAGSYPFDDEGIVPKTMPVIEDGVFKNFIYDLTTAKRMGTKTTGHGGRGVGSLPGPSFSNLIFSTGKATLDEMIADMDYGLLLYDTIGGGMSNVIAGDFSVNVGLGYLIENGKVKGRVKDVMMAGNVFELLNSITAIENKTHKQGSVYAPHILFEKVSVTG